MGHKTNTSQAIQVVPWMAKTWCGWPFPWCPGEENLTLLTCAASVCDSDWYWYWLMFFWIYVYIIYIYVYVYTRIYTYTYVYIYLHVYDEYLTIYIYINKTTVHDGSWGCTRISWEGTSSSWSLRSIRDMAGAFSLMICLLHNWLVVWNMNFICPYMGNIIIPTDELICFTGVQTTNQWVSVIIWAKPLVPISCGAQL